MKKLWITLAAIIILAAITVGIWAIWQQNQPIADTTKTDTNQSKDQPTTDNKSVTKSLTLYYVATEDNGIAGPKLGCGDSLVARATEPVTTDSVLKTSFDRLLAGKDQFIGQSGLYNALYQSDLIFSSGVIADGIVTVNLTGTLKLGGECDNPRVQAQLEQTAKTAASVDTAVINLNGKPLSDSLSLQ